MHGPPEADERKTTDIYRHSRGSVALVTTWPGEKALVTWPRLDTGCGLADIATQHRRASPDADAGTAEILRHITGTWDPENPPMSMERIGTVQNGKMRITMGRLSRTQREYLDVPWDWRGNGPDTLLARRADGTLVMRRNARDGLRDVITVQTQGKRGLAKLAEFQTARAGPPERSEENLPGDAVTLAAIRTEHAWIHLNRLSEEEAEYLGVVKEKESPEAGPADHTVVTITVRRSPDHTLVSIDGDMDAELLEQAGARLISRYRHEPKTTLDTFAEQHNLAVKVTTEQSGGVSVALGRGATYKHDEHDQMRRPAAASAETVTAAKRALSRKLSGRLLVTESNAFTARYTPIPDLNE